MMRRSIPLLAALVALAACGAPATPTNPPPPAQIPTARAPEVISPPIAVDPLGPRPAAPAPPPFTPPAPVVYTAPNGMNVWLLERHTLPIVAATVAVSAGASSDPKDKAGLAWATANMLDEGAGKLGALALARQIDQLGAHVRTGANLDFSHASLAVLKRNLAPAFALFGDVVVRPRFEAVEWKRVHDLWVNELLARTREPDAVASITALRTLYGEGNAYAHPVEGYTASAKEVRLPDLRAFYQASWRPDLATLVVVGDVTRAELDPLVASAFGAWKAPAAPKPAPLVPSAPPPPPAKSGSQPRVAVVDRADAPQSVIALVRAARSASDADAPVLTRVNIALGGSFTSRLNQDLREEHGWSYGAHSRVTLLRGTSSIVASAAVQTEHTGDALKALLKDVEDFAAKGLTEEENAKTRLIARGELVDMFEEVESAAMRLARDAAVGLGPDYEAKASLRRDTAPNDDLLKAAHELDPKDAYVVVVGPRAKIDKQLADLGITATESRDAEGAPSAAKK